MFLPCKRALGAPQDGKREAMQYDVECPWCGADVATDGPAVLQEMHCSECSSCWLVAGEPQAVLAQAA